jgi:hypothetical protein
MSTQINQNLNEYRHNRDARPETGGGAGGGTAGPAFAITTENILTPSK